MDVGDSDQFVKTELRPELLKAPFVPAGIPPRYDHSYYFISKFMSVMLSGMRRDREGDRR